MTLPLATVMVGVTRRLPAWKPAELLMPNYQRLSTIFIC